MQWPKLWDTARGVGRITGHRFRVAVHGFLMPLCAVFILVVVSLGMPAAIKAARGGGQPGTFIAERQECAPRPRAGCDWFGAFVSADGSVRVEDVLLDANTPRQVGDTVPVLYEGQTDPAKVYLREGSVDWIWGGLILLGSAGYLTRWGWRLVRRDYAPRAHRAPDTPERRATTPGTRR